jgi:hypothetical protein
MEITLTIKLPLATTNSQLTLTHDDTALLLR